jgi:hypothetical protein
MNTYTFDKIPGGATAQKNLESVYGIHPNIHSFVDIESDDKVNVSVRGWNNKISISLDTVVIDESLVGGSIYTYGPNTLTAKQLQGYIMNVFNPYSNFLTP